MTVTWNVQQITITATYNGTVIRLQPVICKTVSSSGGDLTLQQVTDNGNTTDQEIEVGYITVNGDGMSIVPDGDLGQCSITYQSEDEAEVEVTIPDVGGYLNCFVGNWNASTNTPTLSDSDTDKKNSDYYVSVAGSVDFGSGSITFGVGDVVSNNGTSWYKKVDNNQASSLPDRVGFAAKNSSQVINATTFTSVTFRNEIEDTDSAWTGSLFTVPSGQGGIYEIFGHATFTSINAGNVVIVGVEVNGSLQSGGLLGRGVGVNGSLGGYGGAIRLSLSAGDTLNMVVYCGNSTTLYNSGGQQGYCSFSAYKMR